MFSNFFSCTLLLLILKLLNIFNFPAGMDFVTARKGNPSRNSLISRKAVVLPNAPDGTDESAYNADITTKCKVPQAGKTVMVSNPIIVAADQTFDCQLAKYQHVNTTCNLNEEKKKDAAVFVLEDGATLKNCFLGYSQESVYCREECTVENVHWLQICDDAISFHQKSGPSTVTGCSFSNAGNKALQSDGASKIYVRDTCFNNVDIAYRSCGSGTCSNAGRSVVFENIEIIDVKTLAGFNYAQGDTVVVKGFSGTEANIMCEDKKANVTKAEIPPGCTISN